MRSPAARACRGTIPASRRLRYCAARLPCGGTGLLSVPVMASSGTRADRRAPGAVSCSSRPGGISDTVPGCMLDDVTPRNPQSRRRSPVASTTSSGRSLRSSPPCDVARSRRDDDRLVAPREAGARKDDRLQQIALAADLADPGQVRTDLAADIADRMARQARRLRTVEDRLAAADVATLRPPGAAPRADAPGSPSPTLNDAEQRLGLLPNGRRILRDERRKQVGTHARTRACDCCSAASMASPDALVAALVERGAAGAAARAARPSAATRRQGDQLRAIERGLLDGARRGDRISAGCAGSRPDRRRSNISASTTDSPSGMAASASSRISLAACDRGRGAAARPAGRRRISLEQAWPERRQGVRDDVGVVGRERRDERAPPTPRAGPSRASAPRPPSPERGHAFCPRRPGCRRRARADAESPGSRRTGRASAAAPRAPPARAPGAVSRFSKNRASAPPQSWRCDRRSTRRSPSAPDRWNRAAGRQSPASSAPPSI